MDPDPGCAVVEVAEFQAGRHGYVDASTAAKVAALAQNPSMCKASARVDRPKRRGAAAERESLHHGPALGTGTGIGFGDKPWRSSGGRATDRDRDRGHRGHRGHHGHRRGRTDLEGSKPGTIGIQSGRRSGIATPESTWSRRAPASLLGLCNRVSPLNIDEISSQIVRSVSSSPDVRSCVETVMACLGRSDSYVDMYVTVLSRAKAVQGVDAAVADFAREFLASDPYRVPSLPEPGADYDAFCHAIREKRRRTNTIDALADLGFGPDLVGHACDAMALLADPDADVDKELVVRFLATTVRVSKRPPSAAVGTVAPTGAPFDLDAFARIAANAGDHGIDTRTRFQMADLAHQSRRPGGRAKRV